MVQQKNIKGDLYSSTGGVAVTTNSLTAYDRSRSVYIGTSQSLDFSFDGINWITFAGLVAGTTLDLQVLGARVTSGGGNPGATDVVFLY